MTFACLCRLLARLGWSGIRCWAILLGLAGGVASAAPANTAGRPLRVCLLSGCDEAIYRTDASLGRLASYLESEYGFECEVVRWTADHQRFDHPEALARADAAVLFVRRMNPDAVTLAAVRRFLAAGRGLVGLRTASHAWETWPGFDVEVLGAKYGRHFGPIQELHWLDPEHPIVTGTRGFTTHNDMYRYELHREPGDLQVILEGANGDGTQPVAWVTRHGTSRIFYLGLGANDEFTKPAFLRLIANGLHWVARRGVPGAELRYERVIMANAYPSAFALGFPDGVSCCYDPIRGGLDYVWDGGFIDVSPARPGMGKTIKPVHLLGPVVYRETEFRPLRPDDPAREPSIEFHGYRLLGDAIEFRYTVEGHPVREEVRARPAGDGISRRITPAEAGASRWWYLPGAIEGGSLLAPGGVPDQDGFRFEADRAHPIDLEVVFPVAES